MKEAASATVPDSLELEAAQENEMVLKITRPRSPRTSLASALVLVSGALIAGCGSGSGTTQGVGGAGGAGGLPEATATTGSTASAGGAGGAAACADVKSCDDKDACTNDACTAGACAHTPKSADDHNPCTVDLCDPAVGVVHMPVDTDDKNKCTTDACDPVAGVSHTPLPTDDSNACTVDSCDKATGVSHVAIDPDDNDVCTTDTCDKLLGVSHKSIVCNDSDACTTDSCNPASGCFFTPIDPSDNSLCTSDFCDKVLGPQHAPISCDDGSVCTTDSCDAQLGCQHAPLVYYTETFASNAAGWTLGTSWGIGPATASSGQFIGNPDPAVDHTPTLDNGVAGVVIGGNLPTTVTPAPVYLTSPLIDLTGVTTPTTLELYRWLNSDYAPFMVNYVDVFDGASWINVFTSGPQQGLADASWTKIQYAVPASALNKAGVQLRFGYSVSSSFAFSASSWNIDDIRLLPGTVPNACP